MCGIVGCILKEDEDVALGKMADGERVCHLHGQAHVEHGDESAHVAVIHAHADDGQ